MTAPDLHPEDLIERDARDLLTDVERTRLDEHLRVCIACRLERVARSDFEREAGQAADGARVQQFIAGLVSPPAIRRYKVPRRFLRSGRVSPATALALVAGLAAASTRWPGFFTANHSIVEAPAPARSSHVSDEPAPPPTSTVAPSPAAVAPGEAARDASRTVSIGPPLRVHPDRGSVPTLPSAAPAVSAAPPSAAWLFENAAMARRAGDHSRAAGLYRELLRRCPESPEARTGLAVFGRMLLDDGADAEALSAFERYLQQGGALEPDAFLGQAIALERLGRIADAAEAWSSLLRAYPDSVHAARARAHLVNLGKL